MKQFKMLLPAVLAFLAPALAHGGDYGNLALAAIYGTGGPWNNRPMVVNNFTPPYFALHPPVYYGDRYYRPYGDSPYASWPQLQPNPAYTPRLQAVQGRAAVTIQNPYYAPIAPSMQPDMHPAPEEHLVPPAALPNSDQPAQPGKVPDVVNRGTGPITIENPYFSESAQYISKQ